MVNGMCATVYSRFNPRRACAARVTVVGLSVCLLLYLTSRMSVHLKNDTVYLTGNEGQRL